MGKFLRNAKISTIFFFTHFICMLHSLRRGGGGGGGGNVSNLATCQHHTEPQTHEISLNSIVVRISEKFKILDC